MGVQLNIKDPETVRLARELAGATGRSITETIRLALERAQAQREEEIARRVAEIRRVSAEFRKHMPPEWKNMTSKEIMDSIYNEDGSFAE